MTTKYYYSKISDYLYKCIDGKLFSVSGYVKYVDTDSYEIKSNCQKCQDDYKYLEEISIEQFYSIYYNDLIKNICHRFRYQEKQIYKLLKDVINEINKLNIGICLKTKKGHYPVTTIDYSRKFRKILYRKSNYSVVNIMPRNFCNSVGVETIKKAS